MKSRLMILQVCGLFLLCMNVYGQYRVNPAIQNNQYLLTGNLQYDLSMDTDSVAGRDISAGDKKVVYKKLYSPVSAGLFSLIIPGAGQFYTRSYLKGSLFLGAEALLWVLYLAKEKNGNDQTDIFKKYADENWSVVRYAGWINTMYGKSIAIDNTGSDLQPWERVNWNELNTEEDAIGLDLTQRTGFTHKLAPYGDQQYYEMIGKYAQFGGGWADATGFTKEDVLAENGAGNVSPQFLAYSKMRGEANDYYNIATTVSYIILANHILSALEAVWNASKLNNKIKLQTHIESRKIYGNLVEFVPTLHIEYEL